MYVLLMIVHKVNIPVWFACFSCRLYIGLIITYLLCIYLYVLYTFIGVFYEIIIIIIIIITRGRPLHYMYPNRKCTPKTLC